MSYTKAKRRILFYSTSTEYGEFSNFARFPIVLKGKKWPTSEHFFQAMKFSSVSDRDEIMMAKTPSEAARRGRDRKKKLRRDWESIKVQTMREAIKAKFTQHPDLCELLLSTDEAILVEHTDTDNYWGDGGDGKGRNMLGRLLMELRSELQETFNNA